MDKCASAPSWHSSLSANAIIDSATVQARGQLDLVIAVLLDAISTLLNAGHPCITIDMADGVRIDQTGTRLLATLQDDCRENNGNLTIANPSPHVATALRDVDVLILESTMETDSAAAMRGRVIPAV